MPLFSPIWTTIARQIPITILKSSITLSMEYPNLEPPRTLRKWEILRFSIKLSTNMKHGLNTKEEYLFIHNGRIWKLERKRFTYSRMIQRIFWLAKKSSIFEDYYAPKRPINQHFTFLRSPYRFLLLLLRRWMLNVDCWVSSSSVDCTISSIINTLIARGMRVYIAILPSAFSFFLFLCIILPSAKHTKLWYFISSEINVLTFDSSIIFQVSK